MLIVHPVIAVVLGFGSLSALAGCSADGGASDAEADSARRLCQSWASSGSGLSVAESDWKARDAVASEYGDADLSDLVGDHMAVCHVDVNSSVTQATPEVSAVVVGIDEKQNSTYLDGALRK